MIKLLEIYKFCEGFEKEYRKDGIKKLISKGYSVSTATNYYNIWRKNYIKSYNTEACRIITAV
jgi:hypothetical protein